MSLSKSTALPHNQVIMTFIQHNRQMCNPTLTSNGSNPILIRPNGGKIYAFHSLGAMSHTPNVSYMTFLLNTSITMSILVNILAKFNLLLFF